MSKGLNRAQIIGYLGHDPDLNRTGDGTAVVNLRIATDESYTDRDGNQQKRATWHHVVCWEGLAETVAEYLEKGSRLYVEGPMETNEYTDGDGIQRRRKQIRAEDVTFLDSRGGNGSGGSSSNGGGQGQKQPSGPAGGQDEDTFEPSDELPF
jgi:single-strand DNA-binding protein